jgi:hypothetical protein
MITLPKGYNLVYNFVPVSLNQFVSSGASLTGATVATTDPIGYINSFGHSGVIGAINGVSCLVCSPASNGTGHMFFSTMAGDASGFAVSPPFYVEVETWMGNIGQGNICSFTGPWSYGYVPGNANSNWYEWDWMQYYGDYASKGNGGAWTTGFTHGNGAAIPALNAPYGVAFPTPASGSWNNAWHKFGILVTTSRATTYVDGTASLTWTCPSDSASQAQWQCPQYQEWGAGQSGAGCSPNGTPTFGIAYLRVWSTNGTPISRRKKRHVFEKPWNKTAIHLAGIYEIVEAEQRY